MKIGDNLTNLFVCVCVCVCVCVWFFLCWEDNVKFNVPHQEGIS